MFTPIGFEWLVFGRTVWYRPRVSPPTTRIPVVFSKSFSPFEDIGLIFGFLSFMARRVNAKLVKWSQNGYCKGVWNSITLWVFTMWALNSELKVHRKVITFDWFIVRSPLGHRKAKEIVAMWDPLGYSQVDTAMGIASTPLVSDWTSAGVRKGLLALNRHIHYLLSPTKHIGDQNPIIDQ